MNKRTAKWRNLSRVERLIEEAKDFRGGSLSGDFLDSRLARELQEEHNKVKALEARMSFFSSGPVEM